MYKLYCKMKNQAHGKKSLFAKMRAFFRTSIQLILYLIAGSIEDIINNSEFVSIRMIWSLFVPQTYYLQPIFQNLPPTNTSIPQISSESKESCKKGEQNAQVSSLNLNLSAEDLMKAGYQANKTPWTQEQDEKLRQLRDIDRLDWAELAKLMPGRNSKMCYSRYRRLQNNTKYAWKKKDNELLFKLVEIHGQDWKLISKQFDKRTYKQVKQHYLNYLRPTIKKDEWTLEEDLKLVEYLNKFGKNWKAIEEDFQGRTQNQIKNRYFGRLKRLAEKKALTKQKCLLSLKMGENI